MDKIRIIWIEDHPDSAPTRVLAAYDPYFEIPYKGLRGANEPFKCINEYHRELARFTEGGCHDVFPAEIIAADYDLSDFEPRVSPFPAGDQDALSLVLREELPDRASRKDYAGFLLMIIHGLHFQHHPTGIVAVTQKMADMPREIRDIHLFLQRAYHANTGFADQPDRSWGSIIEAAVGALRDSIKTLFRNGIIEISPADLMALSADPGSQHTLAITSVFGTRQLPTQGLFIDYDDGEARTQALRAWVDDLLWYAALGERGDIADAKGPYAFFAEAEEQAERIWNAYCDNALINQRRELSLLYKKNRSKDGLSESEKARMWELSTHFSIVEYKKATDGVSVQNGCDVRDIRAQQRTLLRPLRRWAVINILREAYSQSLKLVAKMPEPYREQEHDLLSVDDLWLMLFPIPSTPIVYPWHEEKLDLNTWKRALKERTSDEDGTNYWIDPADLLAGRPWDGEEQFGWKPFERVWMRERLIAFMCEEGLCAGVTEARAILLSYPPTRRAIRGE